MVKRDFTLSIQNVSLGYSATVESWRNRTLIGNVNWQITLGTDECSNPGLVLEGKQQHSGSRTADDED